MKIDKMLKLTLSALLLTASASAYSQEEAPAVVKLKNDQAVTWSAFVNAINDPSTIVAGAVPEAIQTALENAKEAVTNAEKAVATAQENYDNAKTAATEAATAVNTTQAAYNEANNKVNSLKAQLEPLNTQLTQYNTQLQGYATDLQMYSTQLSQLKDSIRDLAQTTILEPIDDWKPIHTAANKYYTAWNAVNKNDTEIDIWYITETTWDGDGTIIYLSFVDPTTEVWKPEGTTWSKATTARSFYTTVKKLTLENAFVYVGKKLYIANNTDGINNDGYLSVNSLTTSARLITDAVKDVNALVKYPYCTSTTAYVDQEEANRLESKIKTVNDSIAAVNENIKTTNDATAAINSQIETINAEIKTYTGKQEGKETSLLDDLLIAYQNAQTALTTANNDITVKERALNDAKTALAEAKADLKEAQDAYDKAVTDGQTSALKNYKDVTLTGDVTADVRINSYDGFINGNNNVITLAGDVDALFNRFNGSLSNIAVNGKITNSRGANVVCNNIAYWIDSTKNGKYYNEDGGSTEYTSLGALGFAARGHFGVDFTQTGANALVKGNDNTIVYNITVYQPSTTNALQYYANLVSDRLYANGNELALDPNTFIKSVSSDLDLDNVIINDNECKKVVITDKKPFYAPFEIQADEVFYQRSFNEGYNTVCLPFDLSSDLHSNINGVFKYDSETSEKFWFTMVDGNIAANTPALINTTAPFENLSLYNVTIAETPKEQLTVGGTTTSSALGTSRSHGTFKTVNAGEFRGQSQAHKVYGLIAGKTDFEAAGDNAKFPAFRMVISTGIETQSGMNKAPRRIGIRDSRGIEITDQFAGVDNVVAAASSLSVEGGVNQIIITSEADYGKVEIYAVDGKLVTVANVVAGTTTVDVESGIYIALGKKVLVK